MGIIRKQGTLTTIIAYVGIGIGFVIVIFILPKNFTPEEVGIRNLVFDIALLFTQLFTLGNGSALIRYYPIFNGSEKNKSGLLTFTHLVPLIVLFVILIFYLLPFNFVELLFEEKSANIIPYFKYCIIIGMLLSYSALYEYYARLLNSFIVPKANREILLRLLSILLMVAYGYNFITFNQFWINITFLHLLILVLDIYHARSIEKLPFQVDFSFFNKKSLGPIVQYSLFAALTGGATILTMKFDSVMVASMIGLKQTAIYTIAIFIVTVIETPRKSLSQVIGPLISSSFANNDLITIGNIYKKTSINQVLIGGGIFTLIWLNIDYLFLLMPQGEFYSSGKPVILILGLAKMVDMISSCNTPIISLSKIYKFNLYTFLFLLICTIVTNYLLIPIYGIVGAALATLISITIFNIIQSLIVYHRLKLSPFHKKIILPTLLFGVLMSLSYFQTPFTNPYMGIIITSFFITTLYLCLVLFTNTAEDLRELFLQIVSKKSKNN